jgi:hypothetical protein
MSTLEPTTVRLPRPTDDADAVPAHRDADRDIYRDRHAAPSDIRRIDAGRLWAGGLLTAVIAALVALVGALVVRALLRVGPGALDAVAVAFGSSATAVLCVTAAVAALAATGLAHLLLLSTPRPLAYLGWVVGLLTAAAAVLPLAGGAPLAVALTLGVVHLAIGLAIGSLVSQAMISAGRYALDEA